MRPLIVSTFDLIGGAARSAFRLHQGLEAIGVPSQMLSRLKLSDSLSVHAPKSSLFQFVGKVRAKLDSVPKLHYSERKNAPYSTTFASHFPLSTISNLNPDIINLHWINGGFIKPETLKNLKRPLVWTLHDMWAFTGGCHYDEGCGRFKGSCGRCPILGSKVENDISRRLFERKNSAWKNLKFTVVTPSRWLSKEAKESQIFFQRDVETIPYGLDLEVFKPKNKITSRKKFRLPVNKKIVLFGAHGIDDPRKGIQFLSETFKKIINSGLAKDLELVIVGSREGVQENCGLPMTNIGQLSKDSEMAEMYSAADVFIAPSLQDNLPNSVLEALACGLPTVAFNIGGMPDMIDHQQCGYLASAFKTDDLARGIVWTLEDKTRWDKLSKTAREKALKEFPLELQAERYKKLYSSILDGKV